MKRKLSLVLVFVMLISMMPATFITAQAESVQAPILPLVMQDVQKSGGGVYFR